METHMGRTRPSIGSLATLTGVVGFSVLFGLIEGSAHTARAEQAVDGATSNDQPADGPALSTVVEPHGLQGHSASSLDDTTAEGSSEDREGPAAQ